MKSVQKIIILIIIQIIIIITSFLIVAYLESQNTLAGHMINIAGKNRVLTSQVGSELHKVVAHDQLQSNVTDSISSELNMVSVFSALHFLEANIHILKNGGNVSGIETAPLSPQFNKEWQDMADMFVLYHDSISSLTERENFTIENLEKIEWTGEELLTLSDILTEKMSKESEVLSFQLVILQILLGIINVIIHIFMIWLILRILSRYAKEKTEQEKFIVLGEFASILAHDIRNPLGTIYNSIQLISKNIQDERGKKEVNRINRSISRMSHQIEGVLNYVKIPTLDLKQHSIKEMLEYCLSDLNIPNNIKLNLPKNDTIIYCDTKKIEFVFTNIILNAVQAIENNIGYITVIIKEDMMNQVTILFENSGDDITDENMKKIFEPLFTTKMHGTGLGLTSCKNIIEVHGGTISVSNSPVTFRITLPRHERV